MFKSIRHWHTMNLEVGCEGSTRPILRGLRNEGRIWRQHLKEPLNWDILRRAAVTHSAF